MDKDLLRFGLCGLIGSIVIVDGILLAEGAHRLHMNILETRTQIKINKILSQVEKQNSTKKRRLFHK